MGEPGGLRMGTIPTAVARRIGGTLMVSPGAAVLTTSSSSHLAECAGRPTRPTAIGSHRRALRASVESTDVPGKQLRGSIHSARSLRSTGEGLPEESGPLLDVTGPRRAAVRSRGPIRSLRGATSEPWRQQSGLSTGACNWRISAIS
jgi:hypothetical protein